MADPLLHIQGLDLAYGTTLVAQGIDMQVEGGEIVALLGASGCGKSSLLRSIAGFMPVAAGTMTLRGTTLSNDHPPESRRLGMVFQDFALFGHQTVRQNIAFGLHGQADAPARVDALLERFELADLAQRLPAQLSGGQQQRVGLARALAPKPDLLLLDEPFANLDAHLRAELGGWCRAAIKAEGAAAILVTHDRHEAMALADGIAVMAGNPGQLRQRGSAEELYQRPYDADVARLMGDCLLLPARAAGEQARSALGEHRLLNHAQGPVQLVVRNDDLQLVPDASGPLSIEGVHFQDGCWHHRVRYDGQTLAYRAETSIVARRARAEFPGALWALSASGIRE